MPEHRSRYRKRHEWYRGFLLVYRVHWEHHPWTIIFPLRPLTIYWYYFLWDFFHYILVLTSWIFLRVPVGGYRHHLDAYWLEHAYPVVLDGVVYSHRVMDHQGLEKEIQAHHQGFWHWIQCYKQHPIRPFFSSRFFFLKSWILYWQVWDYCLHSIDTLLFLQCFFG